METFRPIAMRCTQAQFEEIKPKLTNLVSTVTTSEEVFYLTNNISGEKGSIGNIPECNKSVFNREVHEEWNERIFLEACGIIPSTLKDRLAKIEKEIKEVKALLEEENKPKIGDLCKFWDNDKPIFIVGKLIKAAEKGIYRYSVDGAAFKNCEKIADENFLKAFDSL